MSELPPSQLTNGASVSGIPTEKSGARIPMHQEEKHLPGGWVVQKYGGTSVGKMGLGIADIVNKTLSGTRVAIVCSARSSKTKGEGTTNRLLCAAREAEKRKSSDYQRYVDAIRADHLETANRDLQGHPELLEELIADTNRECDDLLRILESAHHLEEVTVRVEDKIVSKGEKLSCLYMNALLRKSGLSALYIDLADIIPANHSPHHQQQNLDDEFYIQFAQILGQFIHEQLNSNGFRQAPKAVPVITGYFGTVPGGLLNSIGRGYTDLCAALVAVGLDAHELQIWKDVSGVYTADPRKVAAARLLPSISPSEAAELTFYGSEVIHPFTMDQVIRERIPIRIKNVLDPPGEGTVIIPDNDSVQSLAADKVAASTGMVRTRSALNVHHHDENDQAKVRPKRPTAITVKPNIVIVNIHSRKKTRAHGFLASIFSVLDKHHLSVDLISSSEVHVSCALHSDTIALLSGGEGPLCLPDEKENTRPISPGSMPASPDFTTPLARTTSPSLVNDEVSIASHDLLNAVRDLRKLGAEIDLVPNMAILSLVGKELRRMTGISGRFLKTLGDNGINVEMISQGASEINISCVIHNDESIRALNVVHTNLFTFLD